MSLAPLVVLIPLLTAFILALMKKWPRVAHSIATAVSIVVEAMVILLFYTVREKGTLLYVFGQKGATDAIPANSIVPIRIMFEVDAMSAFMALTAATVTMAASIYSLSFIKKHTGVEKYSSVLMLMLAGMLGLVLTGDIFNLFVFFEILSIASCALVAFRTERWESGEAAFKYMVVSTIGGLFLLLAVGIYYIQYGVLNIAAIATYISITGATRLNLIALAILIGVFAMKAGGVPMHFWTPDAYAAAPAPITIMLKTASLTYLYALFRTTFTLYSISVDVRTVGWIIIIIGLLSMLIGVTMAIPQHDVKRLMAYHAISQTGYMMIGVGVGMATLGTAAINTYGLKAMEGGIFHIINNAMYKGLLFLTAGALFYATGTRDLNKMGGLARRMPVTTICFMIGALAIAGIPPFNGYASKLLIYESVYEFNPYLAIIAMLVSILTLASFVKVFHSAFLGPDLPEYRKVKEVPTSMKVGMGVLSGIIIAFGLVPHLVVKYIVEPAALALVNQGGYISTVLGTAPPQAHWAVSGGVTEGAFFGTLLTNSGAWNSLLWIIVMFVLFLVAKFIYSLGNPTYNKGTEQIKPFLSGWKESSKSASHVRASNLYWGFLNSLSGYYRPLRRGHTGIVNDYVGWFVLVVSLILILLTTLGIKGGVI
ncbi:MAG: NADH:ubiquinone oxidoreductase [Thermoplasmata archaeon]|nr:NADH:ubiquinone oxidoreductase [Thermoplasmata archaeon]